MFVLSAFALAWTDRVVMSGQKHPAPVLHGGT
jgi:hypothetical protein